MLRVQGASSGSTRPSRLDNSMLGPSDAVLLRPASWDTTWDLTQARHAIEPPYSLSGTNFLNIKAE